MTGLASLALALSGWPLEKLWLYYLGSASFILVGLQATVAWIQMQVLDALKARDNLIACDLQGQANHQAEPNGTALRVRVEAKV